MKFGKKLLSLGAAAIIAACGSSPSNEYTWKIRVFRDGILTAPMVYHCKSYNIDSEGALNLSDCYPEDSFLVFPASYGWEISRR